jgi:nucleotide-binding universal stress UspA family protein
MGADARTTGESMSQVKSIMVATDLSAPARHAAMRAAMLSRDLGAQLVLTHVVNLHWLEHLALLLGPTGETLPKRLYDNGVRELNKLAAEIDSRYGVAACTHAAQGVVLEEIVDQAERMEADLMVMGNRGKGFVREVLMGSTTERVLRKTTRPLLMVKQMPHEPYRRIMVPVDFSGRSVAAVRLAHAMSPQAELILLHAFEAPYESKLHYAGIDEGEIKALRNAAKAEAGLRMADLLADARLPPGKTRSSVLPGPAIDCILEQEQEQDCDLIVIGKHGYGTVEELLLGSVTKHLLMMSSCDVLVAGRDVD